MNEEKTAQRSFESESTRPELNDITSERASVLIAEDDPDLRAFLCYWLEGEGLKVLTAEDGAEALSVLDDFHPDLILTDIAMPQMDGMELIRQMRQRTEFAKTPIVALTSFRGKYLNAALTAGATVVLRKPEDFDQLMGTIYQVLLDSSLQQPPTHRPS